MRIVEAGLAQIRRRQIAALQQYTEMLAQMRRAGTAYQESTIRTHITSRMCGDAPDHHGTTYDDFQRISGGRYRMRHQPQDGS